MNVVIVGARGLLGSDLVRHWNDGLETGDSLIPFDLPEFDCAKRMIVDCMLEAALPDLIVNVAGVRMIDYLESHPNTARTIHSQAVVHLRDFSEKHRIRLVQLGCAEVFYSPSDSPPHREDESPSPESVFAKTKLESERIALEATNSLVVRTSTLFGTGGGNLVDSLLNAAKRSRRIQVIDNVRTSPTWTVDFTHALVRLVRNGQTGLVHLTNRGTATPLEVARFLFERKGLASHQLVPISLEQYGTMAPHSHNTSLDSSCYETIPGSYVMPSWEDALERYLNFSG